MTALDGMLRSNYTFAPFPFLLETRVAPPQSAHVEVVLSAPLYNAGLADPTSHIEKSGLFDASFYLETYPDLLGADISPLEHYMCQGFRENRKPNPLFDPHHYLQALNVTSGEELNPLLHYATTGEAQGLHPFPLFDPIWYQKQYRLDPQESPFAHYLKNRKGPFSPIRDFDSEFYLSSYPDIAFANADPFQHFMFYGYKEGRNPSADFDTKFYVRRYLNGKASENPLLHYIRNKHTGIVARPSDDDSTIPANVKRFTKPGSLFEDFRPIAASVPRKAKLLAYYLTQFHAFPENDRWWGTGFTEWTNIARGLPRFHGHFQPRVPRDNGFYSLDDENTLRKQVADAKAGGLYGFIFYYYWFNGKRLMEKPLEAFLKAKEIDMPFCLMWANESWTRRWDGLEGEILIAQDYSPDDDDELIAEYARHFQDPRYIRAEGRPLLMIYRPRLVPDAKLTIARWRTIFKDRFSEDPLILMSQSFDDYDPNEFGLDGAIEFPPHKITKLTPLINEKVTLLDDTFSGQIYGYDDVIRASLDEEIPNFPLIKTAVPSWDNDARRQGTGLVVHGSTPKLYENWLGKLVERAQGHPTFGESFVCINAWNEWCEGAYLEPDLHFGSAYLNATARAATGLTQVFERPRVVLLGHDAFQSGAQMLLLNIGRTLRRAYGLEIEFVLLQGGKLEADYESVAPTTICSNKTKVAEKLRDLRERGYTAILANTCVTGHALEAVRSMGYRTVLLVHELPRILKEKGLAPAARAGLLCADRVVFPGRDIQDRLIEAMQVPNSARFLIRPQGSYNPIKKNPDAALTIRHELKIESPSALLVLGVGYADMRKGFDLFLQLWRILRASDQPVHFCWVGNVDPGMHEWLSFEIADAEKTGTFHMAGFRRDVEGFFSAANAFVLTSREDPFPTVTLEAMSVDVPVFAFDRTGGIPDFLKENDLGHVVPYGDVTAMATRLASVLNAAPDRARLDRGRTIVADQFAFPVYVRDLMRLALPKLADVSVVIPNYKYAHCLPSRMATVFTQTYPTHEVIVLDDASPDDSVAVIEATAEEHDRDITLVINDKNSGSVFKQWRRGADMATGDYVWIAEADDLSEPSFLARIVAAMETDPAIVLGFSDSKSIDMAGAPVYPDYKGYYASVEKNALTSDKIWDGADFVRRLLSVKNLILNVSCVVWRRTALLAALDACAADLAEFRMAGDWRIYLETLMAPSARIAYVADPLNVHRRHTSSVTHALDAEKHVAEIARMHEVVRRQLSLKPATELMQVDYVAEVRKHLSHGSL